MKKMKIYMKLKSALVLGLFTLTACTGNYRDFNMNPDNVPDSYLDMDGLRYGSAITSMELDMIPCSDQGANAYQRAQNLTGDIFPVSCALLVSGTVVLIIQLITCVSTIGMM